MKQSPIIAPSLLSANFAKLGQDAASVIDAGADWLHFDVMDNHFVPNLTVGTMVCQALRDDGITAPIDVHLMVTHAERLIDDFAKAGATSISVHLETDNDVLSRLRQINALGCQAALAINPDTPIEKIDPFLAHIDMLLVMSVYPGFGGQRFIPESLDRVQQARKRIDNSGFNIRLQVDGGVNQANIAAIAAAGADTFVAGSAIFGTKSYAETITALRQAINTP